jgi:dCMP deaminase
MQSKEQYYLRIADVVASRSKCLSRKIGAVLVKDDAIISTGFNGPPRGIKHCVDICPRRAQGFLSGEGLELCPATHAEANAIVQAARSGVSTNGATLYLTCETPCKNCLGLIINAGIKRVFCTSSKLYDDCSKIIAEQSEIEFRVY